MTTQKTRLNLQARVCVIGAGPSGLAAIKNLKEQGLQHITAFEKSDQIGGNWVYDPENTHASVYATTHIISSKRWSQFDDFPMPADYPDYPSHTQLLAYFTHYAHTFDLYPYIRFHSTVIQVELTPDKLWQVTYKETTKDTPQQAIFDYLLVANGHHWDPVLPTYPGHFQGNILHAHQYKNATPFVGQKVLVVGGGNSACDIAVEIARVAPQTQISMRRGYTILPKFIFGKPTDVAFASILWLPPKLRQAVIRLIIRLVQGRYAKYQLMKPAYGPLKTHPTINSELLYAIRHGKIRPRPGIARLEGSTVYFNDASSDTFDTLLYATGYQISFPFFDKTFIDWSQATAIPLYKKMMHSDYDNLYFIGLCQPQGCIWPLADYQAKIAARIITGSLKRPQQLDKLIAKEQKQLQNRFKSNRRHALEVEYHGFKHELTRLLSNN